ncbi:hypothetical protein DCO48_18130 [Pseudomonas sp. SDI]|uniref:lysozyme inhibitor LprI family protein n=1 Tax=Pseudomonas sp. SDI TaxID=2170734 RepID=UPI000DE6E894|nr:lysozyme inhibitor LprI family protein [Pseudomonas sp. SDI]PWB31087.1 hypothetical protein DCO48_18130 [Pseudomonas sp. SDI]
MKSMAWLILATLAFGAHAADEEGSSPCDNAETEQQNYDCAVDNRKTAERELSASFDDLLSQVGDKYKGEPAKLNELKKRLTDAENLWKQLRDADCKVETFDQKPGKAFDTAQNNCIAQRSDDRSEYLQSLGLQDGEAEPE